MRIVVAFGTRPEVIKLVPVIKALLARNVEVDTYFTGQHKELYDDVRDLLPCDYAFRAYSAGQAPDGQVQEIMRYFPRVDPKGCLVVQGDTTSAFAAALAAYYQHTKIAHVEAGLRSFDKAHPWPEESHRAMIDIMADFLYCPTFEALTNVGRLREYRRSTIGETSCYSTLITGNTAIDMIRSVADSWAAVTKVKKQILVTLHRREMLRHDGAEVGNRVYRTIGELAGEHPDYEFVYMNHPNPDAVELGYEYFKAVPNVVIQEPMPYRDFVRLMAESHCILTDSGGIVEEAPTLGRRVAIIRDTTERQEAVAAGAAVLASTQPEDIRMAFHDVFQRPDYHGNNPFGDGHAADKIADHLLEHLEG